MPKTKNKPEMEVEVKDDVIIITLPRNIPPVPSKKTGKTLIVATTSGNRPTKVTVNDGVNDQVLTVGVNAYIKNPDYSKK